MTMTMNDYRYMETMSEAWLVCEAWVKVCVWEQLQKLCLTSLVLCIRCLCGCRQRSLLGSGKIGKRGKCDKCQEIKMTGLLKMNYFGLTQLVLIHYLPCTVHKTSRGLLALRAIWILRGSAQLWSYPDKTRSPWRSLSNCYSWSSRSERPVPESYNRPERV